MRFAARLTCASLLSLLCIQAWARPEVTIDPGGLPPEVLGIIHEAVDTIARLDDDEDGGEASRLRRRAREAVLSALATQGYFSPVVTLEVGEDVAGETWDIEIQPGKRATVSNVEIRFQGRISGEDYAERRAALIEAWKLPEGQLFINNNWSKSKTALLESVSAKDFYRARLAHTSADVDPLNARVALNVLVDSGPRVRLGELEIDGLKRVPERLVTRYVEYPPHELYNRAEFENWQQELQETNLFRGAFVMPGQDETPDTDPSEAPPPGLPEDIIVPVKVSVAEAAARELALGLGVDDDVGVRFETLYKQNVVLGHPVIMETGLGVDRKRQRAFLDVYLPPTAQGQKDSIGLLVRHSDIEGLDLTRYALGATRTRTRYGKGDNPVEYETRFGLLLAHDRVKIGNVEADELPTFSGTAGWTRIDVNDKYDPRKGNVIDLQGGVGLTLDDGAPYTRASLRLQQWWPVGPRDVLTMRGEAGKVWSQRRTRVPDDFGFRTGGARTVRGYRYMSIGAESHGATVGGATMAVASIEYMHFFTDMLGMTVFFDAGDVSDSFQDMHMKLGYGVGGVVRTPAGPIELNLAYGQQDHDLRLHFSLGIAF